MAAIGRALRVLTYTCTVIVAVEVLALVFVIIACSRYPQGSHGWRVAHGERIAGHVVGVSRRGGCSVYDRAGNVINRDCETERMANLARDFANAWKQKCK
jgi:hypothetical protein